MNQFTTPMVFQARPSALKKQAFLIAGVLGLAGILWASMGGTSEYTPYCFAGGLTAVAFSLRFYFMMILHGPAALTFGPEGISVADKASHHVVYWADLLAIRYGIAGGHHWDVYSRQSENPLSFYVDGLSLREQEKLRDTIRSISMPNVQIVPVYDPLAKAA